MKNNPEPSLQEQLTKSATNSLLRQASILLVMGGQQNFPKKMLLYAIMCGALATLVTAIIEGVEDDTGIEIAPKEAKGLMIEYTEKMLPSIDPLYDAILTHFLDLSKPLIVEEPPYWAPYSNN